MSAYFAALPNIADLHATVFIMSSLHRTLFFFVVPFTDMEGSGRGLIDICLCGLGKTTKNISLCNVLAEIRTGHLPNTSILRYSYTRLLGAFLY
jgi:hypothetical protein